MRVRVDYRDGQYSLISDPEHKWSDAHCTEIHDSVWRAYLVHLDESTVWYDLIRRIDNDLSAVRHGDQAIKVNV